VQQRIVEALGVDGARAGEERALLTRPEGMARGGDEPAPRRLAPRDARRAEGAIGGQGVEERGQLGDRDALEDGARPAGVTDLDRRGRVAHAIARARDDLRVDARRREGSMERGLEILGVHGSAARARLHAEPQRGSAAPPRFRRRDEAVQRGLGRFLRGHGHHRRLGRRRDRGRRVERAGGAGRRGGMVGARPEPSVEMRDVAEGHASVVGAVDFDQRRHRALEEAVRAFERERLVGAGLPDRDTVTPRSLGEQLAAAEQRAAHPGADARVMVTVGRQAKLGIARRHAPDLAQGHAQVRGHLGERRLGEVAEPLLHRSERGQKPRALAREGREDLHELGGRVVAAHRVRTRERRARQAPPRSARRASCPRRPGRRAGGSSRR
jgi:hypothetical protein